MKQKMKTLYHLFLAVILFSLVGCSTPKPNQAYNFLNLENLQIKSITSNYPEKLTLAVDGSVEENQKKILEILSKAGFSPATKFNEILDFTGEVDDYKLIRLVRDNDPFENLKNNRCFINQKQGVKCTVYDYFNEGTHIRLEQYPINKDEINDRVNKMRKSMFTGEFTLRNRKFTNLDEFDGEDLEGFKAFQLLYRTLENKVKLTINEDGTYEESFYTEIPISVKGNWKLSDDFKTITFIPSDLSGDKITDSYIIKNKTETDFITTADIIKIKEKELEIITTKHKGVKVNSRFVKSNL